MKKLLSEVSYEIFDNNLKKLLVNFKRKLKPSDSKNIQIADNILNKLEEINNTQNSDEFKKLKLLQFLHFINNSKEKTLLKNDLLQFLGDLFNVDFFKSEHFTEIINQFRSTWNSALSPDILKLIYNKLEIFDIKNCKRVAFFTYKSAQSNKELLKRYLTENGILFSEYETEKDLALIVKKEMLVRNAYSNKNLLQRAKNLAKASELGQTNVIMLCYSLAASDLNQIKSYKHFFNHDEFLSVINPNYDCTEKEKLCLNLRKIKEILSLDSIVEFFIPTIKRKFANLLFKHNLPMFHFINMGSFQIKKIDLSTESQVINFLIVKNLTEKSEKYRHQFLNYWQSPIFAGLENISPLLSVRPDQFENLQEYWAYIKNQLFAPNLHHLNAQTSEWYKDCEIKAMKTVSKYIKKEDVHTYDVPLAGI